MLKFTWIYNEESNEEVYFLYPVPCSDVAMANVGR